MRIICESCGETYKDDNIVECKFCQGNYCWRCHTSHVNRCHQQPEKDSNKSKQNAPNTLSPKRRET